MKVTLVPSAICAVEDKPLQFVTSLLINDTVAIDAGSLGFWRTPQDQAHIKHLLISHSHIDHMASLALFVENAFEGKADCVTVHGSEHVLDSIQRDIFNDRLWPDFIKLSSPTEPFLKLSKLVPGQQIELEGLRITPVSVNHVVPTMGFILEEPSSTVIVSSDTAATDELWQKANVVPNLKAVFLEVTFPNNLQWLADVSKHHTPATFAEEIKKLHRPVPLLALHIKARYYTQVVEEMLALGLPNLIITNPGHTYTF